MESVEERWHSPCCKRKNKRSLCVRITTQWTRTIALLDIYGLLRCLNIGENTKLLENYLGLWWYYRAEPRNRAANSDDHLEDYVNIKIERICDERKANARVLFSPCYRVRQAQKSTCNPSHITRQWTRAPFPYLGRCRISKAACRTLVGMEMRARSHSWT